MNKNNDVVIKNLKSLLVASRTYKGAYSDCGKHIGELYKVAGRYATGAPFNRYKELSKKDSEEIEVCVQVKKEISHPEVSCLNLPAVRVASITYQGPYEGIDEAYKTLESYLKRHGLTPKGPYREHFLKGPGLMFKGNPEKYITEIQLPV